MDTTANSAQKDGAERGRQIWCDYERRQEFEHTLIDRKTNWLLATESILFAAFALSFESDQNVKAFRVVISATGTLFALISWFGVWRLIKSKEMSWEMYKAHFKCHRELALPGPLGDDTLQWGVKTWNTRLTLWPDKLLPWVFVLAWLFLMSWSATQ